jgi:hypothetical protein
MNPLLIPSSAMLWGLQFAFLNPALALLLVSLFNACSSTDLVATGQPLKRSPANFRRRMLSNRPHRCRDVVTALPPPPPQQYDDGDGAAKQQSRRPGSHQGNSGT